MRHFLFLLLCLSACAPTYVPNVRNVPLFAESGEFQAAVYITTGIEAQAAYSITDKFAILGDYSHLREENSAQGFTRKNDFYEVGLGYFNAKRSSRFDFFVGYGQGKGTGQGQYDFFYSYFGQAEIITDYKYQRIFIQPSFGTNNRNFNIAFTPRISMVDFAEFTSSSITVKPTENLHFFFEPALTGRFRLAGNLNGIFQLGLNVAIPSDVYFTHVPLQAALGIQLHVGNRLRTRVY